MVTGFLDTDAGWTPLYLSTLAGMSTCLGALIVFCHPIENDDDDDEERVKLADGDSRTSLHKHKRINGRRKVSPSTMAFSLALAGSVMVTVSVVSIGPECLAASSMPQNVDKVDLDKEKSFFTFGITLMPVLSLAFCQRLLSFGAGCLVYFVITKFALPEPSEEILASLHFDNLQSTSSRSLQTSSKSSDDEESDQRPAKDSNKSEKITENNIDMNHIGESPLRNRMGTEDVEVTTNLTRGVENKGVFSRPPAERMCFCGSRFASCISSLRVFTRGSDLATPEARRANRVAMLLFFSLLIHNFPEGLAVAASALESDQLGLTVTIGIMIHNIPEGIAIAVPCLKARPDSPWLCFILASASGLAEPAGAFVSLVLLRGVERRHDEGNIVQEGSSIGEGVLENTLAFVAGIMITVSFLELFPEAKRHTQERSGMKAYYAGLVAGFVIMIATEFGMSL